MQHIRMPGCFWLLAICLAIGCGKSDAPAGSPGLQPVAAQEPQKNEPSKTDVKTEPKNPALPEGTVFRFSDDEAGKILARILPPGVPALAPLPAKNASERTLPAYVAAPDATTVPSTLAPRAYPYPTRVDPRPAPLTDRVPFDLALSELERPETLVLPVGGLTKIDPLDVNMPTLLPILARPTPDRAPLDDPTTEFTARSIINDNLPLRFTMALFVKVNLPDPFENAAAAKVKETIPDDPTKALGDPPAPRP